MENHNMKVTDKELRHDIAKLVAELDNYISGKGNPTTAFSTILNMKDKWGIFIRNPA